MTSKPTKPRRSTLMQPPFLDLINPALIALCRMDFYSFAMLCLAELTGKPILHNYHLQALAFWLTEVTNGRCPNLMINMPPRYAKSIFVSIAWCAYLLGLDPTRQILVISHSLELASKLSYAFRRIMNAPWYKQMFPETQIARDTEFEVVTTKGGCRRAASISGSLTGLGGNPLIFDDPLNAADAYSDSTRQRVNDLVRLALARRDNKKTGTAIIAMQRLHHDDPCGSLLAEPENKWKALRLAAIAEEDEKIQIGEAQYYYRRAGEALHADYESISDLQQIKSLLGSANFAEQYQQSPLPRDGLVFKRAWLHVVEEPPLPTSSSTIFLSFDTAIKTGDANDYTACSTVMLHDRHYYVMAAERMRLEFPDLVKFAKSQAQQYDPTRILVEDSGLGTPLVNELKRAGMPALAVKPEGSKIARMKTQTIKFEGGQVSFVRKALTPDLLAEFLSVPNSRHDDLVDCICQALAYAQSHSTNPLDEITSRNYRNFYEALVFDAWIRHLSTKTRKP